MTRRSGSGLRPRGDERRTRLYDAEGRLTTDPARAVRGEVVEYDARGAARRTWFRIEPVEIKWLPISEPAFLLWVLFLFVAVWVIVAVVLRLS